MGKPRKKAAKRARRLLKRKSISDHEGSSEKLPIRGKKAKRKASTRIKFTKRAVDRIEKPSTGNRDIYRDTHTPHFCLRVTPTAKTFYWEKTVRGSQKKVTIGRYPEINVEQARARAADIAADYVKEKDVQAERRLKRGEGTFGDLWAEYREHRPRRNKNVPYSKTLDDQWNRVLSRWENKKLTDLTNDIVSPMIDKMRERAPVYANRIQRHGQAMYNFARRHHKWRYRGDNPFDFYYVSEEGRERDVRLKVKDMPAFMSGVDACSQSMRLIFLTSLFTGRRVGEVKAMLWDKLDLDKGTWKTTVNKGGKVQTQEIVLPNYIVELLSEREKTNKDWVFPNPENTGHIRELKKAWSTVRKVSGLHELQARDLRRTMASWAQEVNVPIAIVQSQLGHSSITTTAKHYTSIDTDVQRMALERTVESMIEAAKS